MITSKVSAIGGPMSLIVSGCQEWGVVRVALEMVPTSVDMQDSDIQQGTAGHTRDGLLKHLSTSLRCGLPSNARAAEEGAC